MLKSVYFGSYESLSMWLLYFPMVLFPPSATFSSTNITFLFLLFSVSGSLLKSQMKTGILVGIMAEGAIKGDIVMSFFNHITFILGAHSCTHSPPHARPRSLLYKVQKSSITFAELIFYFQRINLDPSVAFLFFETLL